MLFVESMKMPAGLLNWPLPLPVDPNVKRNVPSLANSWMRLLPLSATHTFPSESIAIPLGLLSCPTNDPNEPQLFMNP
ncbi:Uncharacterised protein [uncultured archaeon]|nr:Uncharacterised protein [uncultured archaeon]